MSALALVLAGCAVAPESLSFSSTSVLPAGEVGNVRTALLVVAVGGVGASGTYRFQRIGTDPARFEGPPVPLRFGGVNSSMMARPAGAPSSLWIVQDDINFLVAEVEPGLYAASYAGWGFSGPVSSGSAWHCQTDGAPVFEVRPGDITMILSRDAYPPNTVTRLPNRYTTQEVLDQFVRVRAAYPQVSGEPILAQPTYEARWTELPPNAWVGEPCTRAVDGSVSINPIAGPGSADGASSDAAAAAREAAIRLLEAERASSNSETPAPSEEDQPK